MMGPMSWATRFGVMPFGKLVASDGSWEYQFSFGDLRWAVPMLAGESRNVYDNFAELATMANRLYWTRNTRIVRRDGYVLPMPHTFKDLVLAYSSVIGSWFTDHGPGRPDLVQAEPEDFDPHVVNLAVEFMTGRLYEVSAFKGLVHFAECGFGTERHGEPALHIDNCYWRAEGWPSDLLIVPTPRGGSSMLTPLAVGAGLFGLYLLLAGKSGGWLTAAAALPLVPP